MKNNDSAGDFQLGSAPADVLNTALQKGFGASDTKAWAIGGRYDLMPNVALKAEYQSQSSDVTKNLRNEDVSDTIRVAVDVLF
jgi:predicted porin